MATFSILCIAVRNVYVWNTKKIHTSFLSQKCPLVRATLLNIKVKAIQLQVWTGLDGSRRLRLPDFKTIGT